jgi:CDP-4-dehydro-6-deoxyglucose reductase
MPQLLTLTRAARLVGVTRGSLQKKIKHGELATFEGMIAITELLRTYPEAATQLTDDSMLERVKEFKDNALTKVVSNRVVLPDAQTLATRVANLSQELAKAKTRLDKYASLVDRLKDKLSELEQTGDTDQRSAFSGLNAWLSQALQEQPHTTDLPERLLVKDSLLRIMAAQIKVLPSGHEFLLEGTDTILEAALRAGLAVNYGCSNGNCGLCKARIVSGEVKKIGRHDYVLSAAEKLCWFIYKPQGQRGCVFWQGSTYRWRSAMGSRRTIR